MADDCIDRVIRKLPEIIDSYTGNPEAYFCGVAKYVALEWKKKERLLEPLPETLTLAALDSDEMEQYGDCLDECLDKLAKPSRELALEFYRYAKREKIDHRAALAARLGISANGLRCRAHRVRETLEKCVQECVNR
jgi:DNA-directed RNA polymerase specialized sigma24 family protein